jgi:2-polyprenyl-6-hydroxyphenyl methylase / 3-demethylubiquinone-9 3-methyltransferase
MVVQVKGASIKAREVAHFNALAEKWWDPQGPMRLLHQINPLRLDYVCRHVASVPKATTCLDIGCGGGLLAIAMAQKGFGMTGIDVSQDLIDVAGLQAKELGVKVDFKATSLELFAAKKRRSLFDVIICFEVLEHIDNRQAWLAAVVKLLKPGGVLLCSTINRTPRAFVEAIFGAEYCLGWVPKGTHHYQQLLRPSELTAWLRDEQMHLIDLTGLSYSLIRNTFYFSQSVAVNYFACYGKAQ